MSIIISDTPFDDRSPQDEIDRRRAERLALKVSRRSIAKRKRLREYKLAREEKMMFPNLTGEFDEDSPLETHFPRKRDQ